MPVVTTRHPRAVGILLLMTAPAIEPRDPKTSRPANDVREMTVTIVTLLRVVCGSVTVDAARTGEHRIDLVPGGQSVSATGGRMTMTKRSGNQHQGSECTPEEDCNWAGWITLHKNPPDKH